MLLTLIIVPSRVLFQILRLIIFQMEIRNRFGHEEAGKQGQGDQPPPGDLNVRLIQAVNQLNDHNQNAIQAQSQEQAHEETGEIFN